jgi:hypothetical protein
MPFFGVPIRNGLPIGLGSSAGFGVQPFDPSYLFAAGEQGAWYDPSDFSTLFEDSAGTTPVTGVEQFVGLMLDKSKGLVLGSELVTNGNFSSGTGWSLPAGADISGDKLNLNSPVSNVTSSYLPTIGKTYQWAIEISNYVSGTVNFSFGGATRLSATANGVYSGIAVGVAATTSVRVLSAGAPVASVDNISVRELPGNHAFQTNSLKRPKLAARYNLLTYSEDLTNAAWAKYTIDSTTTSKFIPSTTNLEHYVANSAAKNAGAVDYVWQCEIKDEGYGFAPIVVADFNGISAANGWYFCVDLSNGTFTTPQTFGSGWAVGAVTINRDSSGWNTVRIAFTTSSVSTRVGVGIYAHPTSKTLSPFSFSGDGVSGVGVRNADLRPADQATGLIGPTYQRVAAATVYDTAGFLPYLAFDGLSWSMSTNSIDPGAVDKAQVFAGVRKLSDATQVIAELSANAGSNNGSILSYVEAANVQYGLYSKGTNAAIASINSGFAAPNTVVFTGIGDISGDVATLRLNGAQAATSSADQGTGNFLTYPLFIGGRNNASEFLNGWLSSLIVRFGANLSQSQIEATEAWVNGKTGAY